jgi:hypothetical protein
MKVGETVCRPYGNRQRVCPPFIEIEINAEASVLESLPNYQYMALFVGQLTEVGGSEDARLGVYM